MKVWRKMEGLRSRDELLRLVEEEGTMVRVARRVGCSRQTVAKAMQAYGVKRREYVVSDEMRERLRL